MAEDVVHGVVVARVETLAAMTHVRGDAADRDGEVVRVELEGFPATWPVRQHRWVQRLWVALVVLWSAYFVIGLVAGSGAFVVVLGAVQIVLSSVNLVLVKTQRVQLEPEGYRYGNAFFGGRLRSWSTVDHVRPGRPRWGTHAELHRRNAAWGPIQLHAMTEEQALELQRRVVTARTKASAPPEER